MLLENMLLPISHINIFIPILENICYHQYDILTYLFQYWKIYDIF